MLEWDQLRRVMAVALPLYGGIGLAIGAIWGVLVRELVEMAIYGALIGFGTGVIMMLWDISKGHYDDSN